VPEWDFPPGLPEAATPIDDVEVEGLLPSWIATRADLNAAEQANIVRARQVLARRRRRGTAEVLDEQFVRTLHRMMFGDVWRWAGTYRLTERNFGVDPWQVPAAVVDLMADAQIG
jgi:fido (protein-threonine AMPylation protein)